MKPNGVIQRKVALREDQILQFDKHVQEVSLERFRDNWGLRLAAARAR